MKIAELKDLHNTPVSFTLGSFDGFHLGHAELIKALKLECNLNGTSSLVISFYPHPRQVVDKDYDLKLLSDRDEKIRILEDNGIDFIHFIDFTTSFSGITYSEFYKNYIFANLDVRCIVAGENHGFGKGRSGNSELLAELCSENSVKLISVAPVFYSGSHISSTRIRHCLENGDLVSANKMLGYEYSLSGIVEYGKGIGKTMGFKTANIDLKSTGKAVPEKGVYITKVQFPGNEYGSVTSIGCSPTVNSSCGSIKLEAHIFDFSGDLYGQEIRVVFIERIRDEIKFTSIGELKNAVENDIKIAKFHLNNRRAQL